MPFPGFARQASESLRQIVDGDTARQLVSLELSECVVGRVDVGKAVARLDREFDATDVAKPAVRQAGPGSMPVVVFAGHGFFRERWRASPTIALIS